MARTSPRAPTSRGVARAYPGPGFFSANPAKAWVEKCFLAYTPVWMALIGMMMPTQWVATWSDGAMLAHGAAVALPVLLLPACLAPRDSTPWHATYWFKANVYLAVFGFFGNYFGSEYFFDVLGMVYRFPQITTTLDAVGVGSGRQRVPLIMYFYTHAYFMTYHVTGGMALRAVARARLPGKGLAMALAVCGIGYGWAWLETRAMANPLMAGMFYYEKMALMLSHGSAIYATYFVASFPIWYYLDEDGGRPWSLVQTVGGALSASMVTLYLLDFAARWVGAL